MNENKPIEAKAPVVQKIFRMNSVLFALFITILIIVSALSVFTETFFFVIIITSLLILILTIHYIFWTITIDDIGVEYKAGLLSTIHKQIPYDKINTVDVFISLPGKLLDYGRLRIFTGNDVESIIFDAIEQPKMIKEMIQVRIDKYKAEHDHESGNLSSADEISKLDKLRDEGTITDAEFETEKKEILNK